MERIGYANDEQRWAAVLACDPNADGQFYYSVKTTGVYCRPSCSSRRPGRSNVAFHASAAAAEAAGFRACKRCQPNGGGLEAQHAAAVAKACDIIKFAENFPKLETLAKSVAMSPFHFHRVFKRIVGITPKAYADAHRAERVRESLPRHGTVTEAIYDAGYNSNSRFYEKSSELLGMAPKTFRNGGAGAAIRFAVGQCSLGSILVAASDKGVCAILLGDDPDELIADLQRRFRKADLIGGDRKFETLVAQVVGFVEQPGTACNLPLDIRGTAFQQRVWQALRKIPTGTTTTYAEIAGRIGLPKSVRAVAGAIAANPIAVAVPCHRVIRTDGALSGYRWGIARKRALLKKESA